MCDDAFPTACWWRRSAVWPAGGFCGQTLAQPRRAQRECDRRNPSPQKDSEKKSSMYKIISFVLLSAEKVIFRVSCINSTHIKWKLTKMRYYTLTSSLAWSTSGDFSLNLLEMALSFSDMSWILELKSSFISLVLWFSLSLERTWKIDEKSKPMPHNKVCDRIDV